LLQYLRNRKAYEEKTAFRKKLGVIAEMNYSV